MSVVMTYWPVAPALVRLVDWIYVLRATGPSARALAGAILPQVQWRLAGEFAWRCRDGIAQPIPRVAALGPSTAALEFETDGETVVVGTGVYPEGWATLLPVAAGNVVERVFDLGTLWGDEALAPLDCDPRADDPALAAAVEELLLRRAGAAPPCDPRVAAISLWANGDVHDIDALAATLGVSPRQAERLTLAACGLPPRILANKHRILRMAAVLASGVDNRRDVWSSDYADQSHFIRHFKRFIGASPTRFMTDPDLFVRDVMRVRLAIASRHPLGLAQQSERPDVQKEVRR